MDTFIGEFLHSLKILGCPFAHPVYRQGVIYLLESELTTHPNVKPFDSGVPDNLNNPSKEETQGTNDMSNLLSDLDGSKIEDIGMCQFFLEHSKLLCCHNFL